MKINKITIENFKFHHKLEFEIKTRNCLIYGENGTGKSSIYEALYSNFYALKDKEIANNIVPTISDKFLHRDYSGEDLKVDLLFDNEYTLNRLNDKMSDSKYEKNIEKITLYFANEKTLTNIFEENFYFVINNYLSTHFQDLNDFRTIYDEIKSTLRDIQNNGTEVKDTDLIDIKQYTDTTYREKLEKLIPVEDINAILKNNLQCDFAIEFSFKNSDIDSNEYSFTPPFISIKIKGIKDNGDFKNHFNEAKLKLISIAIYFGLAKKYEKKDNDFKLLVLDDFLTSLDMANRKVIIRYILDNFKEYQIIILTHNLQFNNLIQKLLNNDKWDTKILFTIHKKGNIEAVIKDKNYSYIDEAKKYINKEDYNLEIAGNLLRKEFESIMADFKQVLELGGVERIQQILDVIKHDNTYYYQPHKIINNLTSFLEKLINNKEQPINNKIEQIEKEVIKIINTKFRFNQKNIKKVEFYKNILLNPGSHNDIEREIYSTECKNTIIILEKLKEELDILRGIKYDDSKTTNA